MIRDGHEMAIVLFGFVALGFDQDLGVRLTLFVEKVESEGAGWNLQPVA